MRSSLDFPSIQQIVRVAQGDELDGTADIWDLKRRRWLWLFREPDWSLRRRLYREVRGYSFRRH